MLRQNPERGPQCHDDLFRIVSIGPAASQIFPPSGSAVTVAIRSAIARYKVEHGLPETAWVDIGPMPYDLSELHAAQARGPKALRAYYRKRSEAIYG